ncbi:MAG: T9SS type A sorting domain-containing protein [Bacteroidales bacterium]|nr:T9SS type A sorting domain-containing protein [Bacteroidales bacterium]
MTTQTFDKFYKMKLLSALFTFLFLIQLSFAQCWQKVASKQDHVIAISMDGRLWNWGGAVTAQRKITTPAVLDTNNNWIDIAAGNQFYAALKSDGTLWTWGDNSSGQLGNGGTTNAWSPVMLGNDSNWTKVSCGDGHMVAVKSDGTLWIWGRNNNGQLGKGTNRTNVNIPEQLGTDSNWIDVSAGKNHTLILKSDGSLWFVGACYTTSLVSQLWKVGTTNDWANMGGGSFTDYAVKQNGELWTWNNSNGRNTTPVRVGNQSNWLLVANSHTYSTEYHALFLKNDASLWAIGNNQFGQLGNGSTVSQTGVPVQIGTDNNWRDIVAGSHYSFGLKIDNSFYAWGRNQHAQFGNGENKNTIKPIDNNTFWKEISSSVASYNGHSLAIQDNGTLWAWGSNNDGQLGNGSTYTHQMLPLKVGNDSNWAKVTNGFHFSIAINNDGALWAWGRNGRRQLGLAGSTSNRTTPVLVNNDSDWVDISAGAEFVIALKDNGTLWAWGYNSEGQLGNGNTNTLETPTQIGSDTNWIAVSAGYSHSMGLKSDSTLWTWGSNQHGQLGRGGVTSIPTQVGTDKWIYMTAGGLHSLGIKADSTLWAWGRNLYAQLGDNTETNRSTPTKIGNDSTWISVSAGYEHSLGLQADSSLWAWGRNAAGQLGDTATYDDFLAKTYVPTKVHPDNNWMKIEGGAVNSMALKSNGNLHTFGDSYVADSQMNFPQSGYIYATPQLIDVCGFCATNSTITMSICNGDSVFFNGDYLSGGGQYHDSLINAAGCDSIIILDLTKIYPAFATDSVTACGAYTWIDGITYTTDNNTASHIISNGASNGCDSIILLNLVVVEIDTTVNVNGQILTANATGVNYQWIDCNNNYEPISGEDNQVFVAVNNGNYAVVVNDGNCSDTSDCINVDIIGLSDKEDEASIFLYPNPNNGTFTIETNWETSVEICDALGRIVFMKDFKNGKEHVILSDVPNGIYFIKSKNSKSQTVIRMVVCK